MEKRNITVTLDKAKEWFNSENATLKEIALQAFDKDALTYNFKNIKSFEDACTALGINYVITSRIINMVGTVSKASIAMSKLNIIRKALNLGKNLHLTKSRIYHYPYNLFVTEGSSFCKREIANGEMEVIGKIKSEGTLYNVLGGSATNGVNTGLGSFNPDIGVGFAANNLGFIGCASKEIAQHLGKYFGMLITEAKYADMVDFEIVQDKYHNC